MDYFKSILQQYGILCRRKPQPRPAAFESSAFSKLPPEIIIHINSFLPQESAISFSLSCQPIYFILGAQYTKNTWPRHNSLPFLQLLERDLPNHILCSYCEKLHLITKLSTRSRLFYGTKAYLFPCFQYRVYLENQLPLTFTGLHQPGTLTVLQLAMKRYRCGLSYSQFLKLLSVKETYLRDNSFRHYTFTAKIVASSMIIREQKVVLGRLAYPRGPFGIRHESVCPHISIMWNRESASLGPHDIFEKRLGSRGGWVLKKDNDWEGLVRRCAYCRTDFSLDLEQCKDELEVMRITIWRDLGGCESAASQKWQNYLVGYEAEHDMESMAARLDRGSICMAFEGKAYVRFRSNGGLGEGEEALLLSKLECWTLNQLIGRK